MNKEVLEKNYIYITNRLFDQYPGLRNTFKYFELPGKVKSCLGIIGNWNQVAVVNLFHEFTMPLPDNTDLADVVDTIAAHLTVILSWDKLVDKMAGGNTPMIFKFGPPGLSSYERVRLHTVELTSDGTLLILTFEEVSTHHDKVVVTFEMKPTVGVPWNFISIVLRARNLEVPILESEVVTMDSFRFSKLEELMQRAYRFVF